MISDSGGVGIVERIVRRSTRTAAQALLNGSALRNTRNRAAQVHTVTTRPHGDHYFARTANSEWIYGPGGKSDRAVVAARAKTTESVTAANIDTRAYSNTMLPPPDDATDVYLPGAQGKLELSQQQLIQRTETTRRASKVDERVCTGACGHVKPQP